jgi:hypothetical protein
MHAIDELKDVYEHDGPFATVHLDASRNSETAAHEVEVRWRELRRPLTEAGADEATVTALEDAVLGVDEPGPHGRFLVAANGNVLFDRPLRSVPPRPSASWDVLPHVMPYVAETSTEIAYIVVVADRLGADLQIVLGPRSAHETVEGDQQHPIHKTRRNQWNERHFQNRVDNAWDKNEREVANAVVRHVGEVRAELVVIAGEERAVALLRRDLQELLPPGVAVAEVGAGGRAAGASEEALREAVHDEVLKLVWRRRRELIERLEQDLGRRAFALTGAAEVIDALRKAQADTVVLNDDPSSTLRAWIGPEPLQVGTSEQDLHDMGVDDPREVRFDAALTRAAVGSGADIEVTPPGHKFIHDGIAALLRYDDAVTPS